ncbi:Putative iron-sulfur cluster binding protein, partial, 5' end [Candidatus Methylomirabilis oxygeniifera]|uniref:Putative iron-sulfur cluster binding protein, partial, 5' end n=1 Tax=Methylomirabilis oxygeniifera TaxID=671143 RepID=D5MKS4_METO1
MTPMREVYWNIPGHLFLYLLFFPFLVVWVYGIYRHTRMILAGEPAAVLGSLWDRFKGVIQDAAWQRRIPRIPFQDCSTARSPGDLPFFLSRPASWPFKIISASRPCVDRSTSTSCR